MLRLVRCARELALHDGILLAYFLALSGAVAVRGGAMSRVLVALDLAALLGMLALKPRVRSSITAALVYRFGLVALPVVSYLELRTILPEVAPDLRDDALLAFDLRAFGGEPAIAWDHLVTPRTTEWFSFFYYSYFLLLAAHAIPLVLFARDGRILRELTLGLLSVVCIGQLGYLLVPAVGPGASYDGFTHAQAGRYFWPLVERSVNDAGALRDVFPSLHTAAPLFLALFSFRHRQTRPYRYSWPIVAVVTSQIVIATMFLRWHYAIDVVVGAALAIGADLVSPRLVTLEARARPALSFGTVLHPPWNETCSRSSRAVNNTAPFKETSSWPISKSARTSSRRPRRAPPVRGTLRG
jgi:hypothetical protein